MRGHLSGRGTTIPLTIALFVTLSISGYKFLNGTAITSPWSASPPNEYTAIEQPQVIDEGSREPISDRSEFYSSQFGESCLESWVGTGTLDGCHSRDLKRLSALAKDSFDIVWTWVNGSDPVHQSWRSRYLCGDLSTELKDLKGGYPQALDPEYPLKCTLSGTQNAGSGPVRYRERGELRYSLRSAYSLITNARKLTVLSADFLHGKKKRIAQLPSWFDKGYTRLPAKPNLEFLAHSKLFRSQDGLPSFSSYSIESQLGNMLNSTPYLLYMNDDYFVAHNLSTSDIWNPLNGPVLHLLHTLEVPFALTVPNSYSPAGEWPALSYANRLLSNRFGIRSRQYVTHTAKVLSDDILKQIQSIWSDEIAETASHRFRTQGENIHLTWMATHYLIERHREILLWSLLLFREDNNGDGLLDDAEYNAFMARLRHRGSESDGASLFSVLRPVRDSSKNFIADLMKIPWDVPLQNAYIFSSQDGFPYPVKHMPGHFDIATKAPIFDATSEESTLSCTLSVQTCFPTNDTKLLFRHVTYEEPSCGDCLITAILGEAQLGLDAFLPPSNAAFPKDYDNIGIWDFSEDSKSYSEARLPALDPALSLRTNVIKLIHRFSYSIGQVPVKWVPIGSDRASAIAHHITEIQIDHPAFYIVQDEQTVEEQRRLGRRHPPLNAFEPGTGKQYVDVNQYLDEFWRNMYPERPHWEKTA